MCVRKTRKIGKDNNTQDMRWVPLIWDACVLGQPSAIHSQYMPIYHGLTTSKPCWRWKGTAQQPWSARESQEKQDVFKHTMGQQPQPTARSFHIFPRFQMFLSQSLTKKHCLTSTKVGTCCYTMSVGVIVGKVLDEPWQALQASRHHWIEVGWHHNGHFWRNFYLIPI